MTKKIHRHANGALNTAPYIAHSRSLRARATRRALFRLRSRIRQMIRQRPSAERVQARRSLGESITT